MTVLDAEDEDRMERLDLGLVRRRMAALRALDIPRGTPGGRLVAALVGRRAIDLSPGERHQVALLCWAWRRRGLPHGLAPKINPGDPLSADQLALALKCGPTLARARAEQAAGSVATMSGEWPSAHSCRLQ